MITLHIAKNFKALFCALIKNSNLLCIIFIFSVLVIFNPELFPKSHKSELFVKDVNAQGYLNSTLSGYFDDFYNERVYPFNSLNSSDVGENGVILHGSRNKKEIALTFDAEMTDAMKENFLSGIVQSSYDKRIVDILNQSHTKATMFLTGMWMELYPDVVKEFVKNPLLELASHSYTDSSYDGECFGLPQLPEAQKSHDIDVTQTLLKNVTGFDNKYFRFPGGCYSSKSLELVTQKGLLVIHWDVTGEDGFNENTQLIEQQVTSHVQNGSIIILHLNGSPTAPKTADALPEIISVLKMKGYSFVTISELLGIKRNQSQNKFDIQSLLVSMNF